MARLSSLVVDGATLSVEEQGDGTEAIVFAHGVLLDKRMFDRQMEALRDHYRCIAFDFRGHGRSEVTSGGYEVDELTQDAAGLIEQLQCSPCHFVGHSLGSFVGIRLAIRRPELVRSLVLLAPSADPQPRRDVFRYRIMQAVARLAGMAPLARPLMKTLFGRSFLSDPDRTAEREEWRRRIATMSLPAALRAVDGVLSRRGVRDQLPCIKAPTLVITGDEDVAAPRLLAQRVLAGIPDARLVTMSGAGHVAPVERPDEVTASIEDFLKGIGTPDSRAT